MSPASLSLISRRPTRSRCRLRACPIRVGTNDSEIHARLSSYYRPWVVPDGAAPLADVRLIQGSINVARRVRRSSAATAGARRRRSATCRAAA